MHRERRPARAHLFRLALAVLAATVFGALAWTIVTLPPVAPGLSEAAKAALPASGIPNPVTATLLDFRSYDTLLEIAVLLLAATAIAAVGRNHGSLAGADDEILGFFARVLVPVMILIAGYLLMAGFDSPGGAFQAGAVLAAAGILRLLAGEPVPLHDNPAPVRLALAIGLALFITAGVIGMVTTGTFLDHPDTFVGPIMLVLELGVSVSVAFALLMMLVGVLGRKPDEDDR